MSTQEQLIPLADLLDAIEIVQAQLNALKEAVAAHQVNGGGDIAPNPDPEPQLIGPNGDVALPRFAQYVAAKKVEYATNPYVMDQLNQAYTRFIWWDMPHLTEVQRAQVVANGSDKSSWLGRLIKSGRSVDIEPFVRYGKTQGDGSSDQEFPNTGVLFDNWTTVKPGSRANKKRIPWTADRAFAEAKKALDFRIEDGLRAQAAAGHGNVNFG